MWSSDCGLYHLGECFVKVEIQIFKCMALSSQVIAYDPLKILKDIFSLGTITLPL